MTRLGLSHEEQATARVAAEDRREMVSRALAICPDIADDESVVAHLHALGMTITQIDRELAEMIDEARAQQNPDTFTTLGDAASAVVSRLAAVEPMEVDMSSMIYQKGGA